MNGAALGLVLATVRRTSEPTGFSTHRVGNRTLLDAANLADRNGLYYPFMRAWLEVGGHVPTTHLDRWAKAQADRDRLRQTIGLLNQVRREAHADYVVIKDSAVPHAVPRDIDIFVPPSMQTAFVKVLEQRGFVSVFDDEAERAFAGPDTTRVDVYNRIHYLGRDFLPLEFLWSSRIVKVTHGVEHPGLDPAASFLMNSIHGLLGHAGVSLLDFLDLCSLQDALGDLTDARAHAAAAGWGRCFDRWVAYIDELRGRVFDRREVIRFPLRHGHRLIRECLGRIDGGFPALEHPGLFGLNLLWDDLVFYSEGAGLTDRLRGSRMVGTVANAAGHRLRVSRGDRKGAGTRADSDMQHRTRTRFR